MIAILSSAKTLDFSTPWKAPETTQPERIERAKPIMGALRKLSASEIAKLMGVSAKIAQLNAERFRAFDLPMSPQNAKPAILAYQGDVYKGLQAGRFTVAQLQVAQRSLRIVSGLYGLLRPLDLIQPYRLEMAVKLSGNGWQDLYDYWSDAVTELIARDAAKDRQPVINLASQEYSRALQPGRLSVPVLAITFMQDRRGKLEMVPILAKRARGLMARHLVIEGATDPEPLKRFRDDGYRFAAGESSADDWVFVRKIERA